MRLWNATLDSKELQLEDDFTSLTFYGQNKLVAKIINSKTSNLLPVTKYLLNVHILCWSTQILVCFVFFPRYRFGLIRQQQAGSVHFKDIDSVWPSYLYLHGVGLHHIDFVSVAAPHLVVNYSHAADGVVHSPQV